jgi:protein-L-isoaspartate(D-aspartate) O-methyltransferase
MENYQNARMKMVEQQLINRGIKDERVLRAMQKVERHRFVDKKLWNKAYSDSPLLIACHQTISQPYMVALMTELLQLKAHHKVLEIGTGSGYQTAILAELSQSVYSIERHAQLAEQSRLLLDELGYNNIIIKEADGTLGWPGKRSFDAIIVSAGAPDVPEVLVNKLVNYGKMVIPVGTQYQQELMLVSKRGDSYISKIICNCIFVPLIGVDGWEE